jgi:hypothetical protein
VGTKIEWCDDPCSECGSKIPVADNPSGATGDIQCRPCRDRLEAEIKRELGEFPITEATR